MTIEQRAQVIVAMRDDGHTLAQIAERLNTTKNAIIGFQHRHIPETRQGNPKRAAAWQLRRDAERAQANAFRAEVAKGRTILEVGAQHGMTRDEAYCFARRHKISAAPRVAQAKPKTQRAAVNINPYLRTTAQVESLNRQKTRMWGASRNARLRHMPPPSRDEADALVRDFLARGGTVKECPPPAQPQAPINAGAGFGFRNSAIGTGWVQARRS